MKRFLLFISCPLVLGHALIGSLFATGPEVHPIPTSPAGPTAVSASGDSVAPWFSRDGHYLFFQSNARDLIPETGDGQSVRLYRYDISSGTLESLRVPGIDQGYLSDYTTPSGSAGGNRIAFASTGFTNLNSDFGSRGSDIYWAEFSSDKGDLVSKAIDHPVGGNSRSKNPELSADGRWVVWESDATNLTVSQKYVTNRFVPHSIYLRDLDLNKTVLINPIVKEQLLAGESFDPSLSANGNRMAFVAHGLNSIGTPAQVYVRDNLSGRILWKSTNNLAMSLADAALLAPQILPDGNWVAFVSRDHAGQTQVITHNIATGDDYALAGNPVRSATWSQSFSTPTLLVEEPDSLILWDLPSNAVRRFAMAGDYPRTTNSPPALAATDSNAKRVVYVDFAMSVEGEKTNRYPQVFLLDTTTGNSERITSKTNGKPSSQVSIVDLSITADGKWVTFATSDTDLVEGDSNKAYDVFLYDTDKKLLTLVSKHSTEVSAPVTRSALVGSMAISADNRWVVYAASDSNRVAEDTNDVVDVFVTDLASGSVRSLSRGIPSEPGIRQSFQFPQITLDGQYVAFLAMRTDLQTGALRAPRMFVTKVTGDERTEVIPYTDEIQLSDQVRLRSESFPVLRFQFSADSRSLIYATGGDKASVPSKIHLYQLESKNNLTLRTQAPIVIPLDAFSGWLPTFSRDGTKVRVIGTTPTSVFAETRLLELDVAKGTIEALSTFAEGSGVAQAVVNYSFSEQDNLAVVVSTGPNYSLGVGWVFDRTTGTALSLPGVNQVLGVSANGDYCLARRQTNQFRLPELVRIHTRDGNAQVIPSPRPELPFYSVGSNPNPILSRDGQYALFIDVGTRSKVGEHSGQNQLYIWDASTGLNQRIPIGLESDKPADSIASTLTLAPDGKTVVFRSWATDLVKGTTGNGPAIYLLTLPTEDSDHDGLPDDWEMAYFNTLDRDGTGDFDLDGQSDAAEFQAGTDPTNKLSVLRAFVLKQAGILDYSLLWSAVPGRLYQIQARDNLPNSEWKTLGSKLAQTSSETWTFRPKENSPSSQYFRLLEER